MVGKSPPQHQRTPPHSGWEARETGSSIHGTPKETYVNLARTHSRSLACSHTRFKRYREGVEITIVVIILYVLGISPEWISCSAALAGLCIQMGVDRKCVAGSAGRKAQSF